LQDRLAVGTGVEPVRACAHEFSRLAHYRPAHPPKRYVKRIIAALNAAEEAGFEPTRVLRLRSLANFRNGPAMRLLQLRLIFS
jgi:hypothetical protein